MNQILEQIYKIGIIPVIAIDDPDKAVPLAKALVKGGLPAAEITFRTQAAEASIRAICKEVPEMLVGAGTVTTSEQLDCALAAGAKFIVSPGFNPDMVKYGLSKGALMLPGTATGGEMEHGLGCGEVFPCRAKRRYCQAQSTGRSLPHIKVDADWRHKCQKSDGLPLF